MLSLIWAIFQSAYLFSLSFLFEGWLKAFIFPLFDLPPLSRFVALVVHFPRLVAYLTEGFFPFSARFCGAGGHFLRLVTYLTKGFFLSQLDFVVLAVIF